MAVDLKDSSASELLQAVQYWDDSLDVWFKDASRLSLSGCGTAFTYWSPARAPKYGRLERERQQPVHQFTQYAISEYRQKVGVALTFRNRFAPRAYVTRTLTDGQALQVRTVNSSFSSHSTLHCFSPFLPLLKPSALCLNKNKLFFNKFYLSKKVLSSVGDPLATTIVACAYCYSYKGDGVFLGLSRNLPPLSTLAGRGIPVKRDNIC